MAFIRAYLRLHALSRSLAIRICALLPILSPHFCAFFISRRPISDTPTRALATRRFRYFRAFSPFPSYLPQFFTKPSQPYTHFEALVRLFLSGYSPSSSMQPSSRFFTLASLLLQY
ncbi:uncharacterized protein F5891DRAFT_1182141 [Suillus fuscotomentosus]|uniref:Uncharacterized protein n=1 Tax=Suillus fuscotomentosus TaxID=1912939 RepID=A0AAD4HSA6_9AGAM|nr:uncharacterized protein F5891DRAFT_1182141 [Suillus fuscotomentosus]KAG1906731.1 hypothetical protein F5891DRAFT_1182141 [Suillus fuscotomentosus]